MKIKPKQIFSHLFNATFNHDVFFKGAGWLNQKFGFIEVIYCGYPSNKKYLAEYDSKIKGQVEKYKYRPYLAGFFIQNKRLGFKFFISATEEEFSSGEGLIKLSQVKQRIREIKTLLNAKEQSFAGIVSGLLYKNGYITSSTERDKVVRCVIQAIDKVRNKEGYDESTPIIILGAKGYIGREVAKQLTSKPLYLLDINPGEQVSSDWPSELTGRPAILVNISRKHQLKHYLPLVWKALVLLNEVYPEPNEQEVALYAKKGGNVYHLSGVKGWSMPPFPGGYENAIPCSASWSSKDIEIVVKKLN